MVGHAVVVAPHHRSVVGIGADDGNFLGVLLQWQDIIFILKEHNGLAGHVEGRQRVFLARHLGIRDLRPLNERRIVHLAQVETALQQADDVLVDLGLGHQAAPYSLGDALVGIAVAALHIGTGYRGLGRGMGGIGR